MAQQQPNNGNRNTSTLIIMWVLLTAWSCYFWFFAPKPVEKPEQMTSLLTQAQTLEAEGRKEDPNVPKTDRAKKLDQAVHKYEEFYQKSKNSKDPAVLAQAQQARFQEVNIYDYLANGLNGTSSDTHWLDQATPRLKDMEKDFLGKTGTVDIERNGKVEKGVTGDLGKVAENRLNEIRADRDGRKQSSILYRILNAVVSLFGGRGNPYSYFLALLTVVVVLKSLSFPLQKKQYRYQQDMMRIQPLLKELQEKMKGRPPEEIQKRTFELYKENNVNVAAGCLPMLVLAFVLFPVYWMVQEYEYQFTYGKFLWIGTAFAQKVWWLADNLAQFDVPLFFIYLATTIIYSLMQPKPVDPEQAKQQRMMMFMMPIMFGFMMWTYKWSSAFMLYWLLLNLVSMYQSWVLNKQFGLYNRAAAASGGSGGSSGSGGGGGEGGANPVPVTPLSPMKGVQTKNGKNGNGRRTGVPGRIRPRGSGRR